MTRTLRAWWKQLRNRVRAVWERVFGSGRRESRAGLAAPPPEGVVEPEPSPVETPSRGEPERPSVLDAEYEEVSEASAGETEIERPSRGAVDSADPVETAEAAEEVADTEAQDPDERSASAPESPPETDRDIEDEPDSRELEGETTRLDERSMLELESLLIGSPANVDGSAPPEEGRDARFMKDLRRGRTGKRPPVSRPRTVRDAEASTPELKTESETPPLEAWVDRELERLDESSEPEGGEAEAIPHSTAADAAGEAPGARVALRDAAGGGSSGRTDGSEGAADAVSEAPDGSDGPADAVSEAPDGSEGAADAVSEAPDGSAGPADAVSEAPDGSEGEEPDEPSLEDEEAAAAEEMAAAAAAVVESEAAAMEAARLATAPRPVRRSKRMRLAEGELIAWRRVAESELKRRERAKIQEALEVPNDYVPMVESRDMLFQLRLSSFEGPLDLLLFLIRRHKIDVFDIPIGFICAEYLRYIKMMEDLNIDVASEFLFMASELLHIKSKMLLPKPAEVDDEDDIDPRSELVARLLEYQKYKDAAAQLHDLSWLGRDRFPRAPEPLPPREGEAPLKEVGVFALIEAFNRVLERQKPEVRHQVMLEQVSVRQRIKQVIQLLLGEESVEFVSLLEGLTDKVDVVVTFLACLEMAKRQLLRLYLSETETLYLHPRFVDIDAAMSLLEGLEEHEYA